MRNLLILVSSLAFLAVGCDDDDDNASDAIVKTDGSAGSGGGNAGGSGTAEGSGGGSGSAGESTQLYEMRQPLEGMAAPYRFNEETGEAFDYAILMTSEDEGLYTWIQGQGTYWCSVEAQKLFRELFTSCSDVMNEELIRTSVEPALRKAIEDIYHAKVEGSTGTLKDLSLMIGTCSAPTMK